MRFIVLIGMITLVSCGTDSTSNPSTVDTSERARAAGSMTLLVGSYTGAGTAAASPKGLYLCTLDNGKVKLTSSIEAGINPSYVAKHPTKSIIYVANEMDASHNQTAGAVTAMAYDDNLQFS
ncbi:MAG: beta-propeller fold lactonase family protein, partial [Bacteroidota bacterium]